MIVIDGYILATDKNDAKYEEIKEKMSDRPIAPSGYVYKLKEVDLQWELCILPEPPEPMEEEAQIDDYKSALNTLGVETS